MGESGQIWGIVLAAGDGTRLSSIARDREGRPAPKQFSALGGRRTLLEESWSRLGRFVPPRRIVTVVAEAHREHWSRLGSGPFSANFVVQPANRGTAAGVLLPLLEVVQRDPAARVVLCPSDHGIRDEKGFGDAVEAALEALEAEPGRILLLGVSPDSPDGEYGWIVPAAGEQPAGRPVPVARFVEKPGRAEAAALARAGAVWNSFWIVARARTLASRFRQRQPELDRALRGLRARSGGAGASALAGGYSRLPALDFSRDLLEGAEAGLRLVRVPACGWSDLGTPDRLRRFRADSGGASVPRAGRWRRRPGPVVPRGAAVVLG